MSSRKKDHVTLKLLLDVFFTPSLCVVTDKFGISFDVIMTLTSGKKKKKCAALLVSL